MNAMNKKRRESCLRRFSHTVISALEQFYFRVGVAIGGNPWTAILACCVIVAAFAPGIPLFFYEENRQEKLWTPEGSQVLQDQQLVETYFPSSLRFQSVIITADDVLQPAVISAMLDIDQAIKAVNSTVELSYNWTSVCARFGPDCWSNSLLELWSFDDSTIRSLTKAQILDAVNNIQRSPVYRNEFNASDWLGDVQTDAGRIVSAKAAKMQYVIEAHYQVVDGREVDEKAQTWEQGFLNVTQKGHPDVKNVYYYSYRTFSDEGAGAIFGDISLLSAGYFIIIIFVTIILGKFNCVQQKIYLTLGGVLCVGLSIAVSFGLCSYAGVFYGPVHSILPFLLIGIGVDDMFVIVQAWDNMGSKAAHMDVPRRTGLMMRHAGVSITVTSITDIVAFGIGATTILPALRSFCIYACVGILFTFVFQASFFVACLSLDARREGASRNACCCCYRHKDYSPNSCSQRSLLQLVFQKYYGPAILRLPSRIMALVLTAALLAGGIYGMIMLRQDFDPMWFIPSDSYAQKYIQANDKYFPEVGRATAVYLGKLDYHKYATYAQLEAVCDDVITNEYTYPGTAECWFVQYRQWLNTSTVVTPGSVDQNGYPSSESNYYNYLNIYLYSDGRRFMKDLNITDGRVVFSAISLKHRDLDGSREEIAAMESLRDVCKKNNLGYPDCIAYSARFYASYEGNKVIQVELYRNLALAFACILVMTLLLIFNLWTCLFVCTCVLATLVDVAGMMYYWGLTIDTVTSIILILAIGLSVDYAAHIGHKFMTVVGTRKERTIETMAEIGPAVLSGGFSTFLAFVLLAGSNSYVFQTFFKVFFGVVVFGLFHGLVYLPVVLSLIGPAPYLSAEENREELDSQVRSAKEYKETSNTDITVRSQVAPVEAPVPTELN